VPSDLDGHESGHSSAQVDPDCREGYEMRGAHGRSHLLVLLHDDIDS